MKKTIKIYVDYALGGKIGIFSKDLKLEKSYSPWPWEKIDWQIEGEALAIKKGVELFLRTCPESKELTIYTDNKTLLRDFRSLTQAGNWRKKALQLAKNNDVNLKLKWVAGKDNPADKLTRNRFYYQEKREKTKIGRAIRNYQKEKNLSWKQLCEQAQIKKVNKNFLDEDAELSHPTQFSLEELKNYCKNLGLLYF